MKEVIIAIIGSGAFTGVILYLIGMRSGVRILLYDKIKYLGRKYIEAKEISEEDLEDLIHMHEIYHSQLKGNGYLDGIMDKVRALPVKKEKETS